MKKKNILNLIKYHVEKNDSAFKNESITIARYFDSIGDQDLAEYILGLLSELPQFSPQNVEVNSEFLEQLDTTKLEPLHLPVEIVNDIKGIVNAVGHNVGINKFLFEGYPGSGKTEAAKQVTRLLNRNLYRVDLESLIDSKLGKTNKNIIQVFDEIHTLPNARQAVILFDEIDIIALDRVNSNDVREMGRVTSTILRELDRLSENNKDIILIATTNLFNNFDKALLRRFDATINFNRYTKEDLIEISEFYFSSFIKNFKSK